MKYKIRYTIMSLFFTGILGWAMYDVAVTPDLNSTATSTSAVASATKQFSVLHLIAPRSSSADAFSADIPPGTNPTNYYGTDFGATNTAPANPPAPAPSPTPSPTQPMTTSPSGSHGTLQQSPPASNTSNSTNSNSNPGGNPLNNGGPINGINI